MNEEKYKEVIDLVNENLDKVFWNYQKTKLLLNRAKAYGELARLKKMIDEIRADLLKDDSGDAGEGGKCEKICGDKGYNKFISQITKSECERRDGLYDEDNGCCCYNEEIGGTPFDGGDSGGGGAEGSFEEIPIEIQGREVSAKQINGNEPTYRDYVNYASEALSIDPNLILAIINVESNGDKLAKGENEEWGLMQLRDGPYGAIEDIRNEEKGRCYNLCYRNFYEGKEDSWKTNPKINIGLGTCYLKCLKDVYKIEEPKLVIAAYNAGPTRIINDCVKKSLSYDSCKDSLPSSTRDYIDKIIKNYEDYTKN